ncbi:MAG: hypothetical protein A4E42_00454 [Methanoregulaceae archaeon PtaU1.Bin222]|nr:MAG: hypothetical protein A4E42_00454 [Methanoregulaceae archaeon PtaU1.Bin222]
MTDYTPILEMLIAVVIPAVIAYWQKSQKDEAAAFMDPANTDVTKAPLFVPATAFVMSPETKAEIIAGRSLEETQKILAEIQKNEDARVKSYTIKTSDGEYGIEYGYIKTRPVVEEGTEPLPPGDFDPKIHTAEEAGIDKNGNYVRGLHMPESRLKNLVHNHTLEDQASMKEQVANAEAQGERNYIVKFGSGFYIIENGIVIGGSKG